MPRKNIRSRPWPIIVAMVYCALIQPAGAITSQSSIATLLAQTEEIRTTDHPRFLRLLDALHEQISSMSPDERWQLRYLDAWQAAFRGDYANADSMLRDIIDHSADSTLATKASAILMNDMGSNRRYEEAFELANQLVANLPKTKDKLARFQVFFYLSQLLNFAGQNDLAADYAHDMMQTLPQGETSCKPQTMLINVLYEKHQLTPSSAVLQQGIDACLTASQPIFVDTIRLIKSSIYLDENKPDKAIALLNHIAPSIRANPSYYHTQEIQVELAQAYWKLGNDSQARRAALAALTASDPSDLNGTLRDAYEVLYSVEKKRGHAAAALAYYEHYVDQKIGYLNDISARTLAYEEAQQHMLAQKLDTEKLSKQNSVLLLQQALSAKMIETSRLYILMLLLVLTSVIFWLFRIKRSQLRFKQQARLDGLTGALNHQHFISEAERTMYLLERKRSDACLIFIDLDHFKQINDTHGHAVGDAVLKHTVTICQQSLRANDLFGRLGGEEFGILLVECPHARGMTIADRIRIAIEAAPALVDEHVITFSASIGLASTETTGYELQRLCRDADAALYRAKRTGRNRVISDAEEDDPAQSVPA